MLWACVAAVAAFVLAVRAAFRIGREDGLADGFNNGMRFYKARSYMWTEYENGKAD